MERMAVGLLKGKLQKVCLKSWNDYSTIYKAVHLRNLSLQSFRIIQPFSIPNGLKKSQGLHPEWRLSN